VYELAKQKKVAGVTSRSRKGEIMELLGIPPTQTQAEEDTELKNFALPNLPKSEGVGIMVLAFCSPPFGWLSYSDEAWKRALEQHPHWATDEEKHRFAFRAPSGSIH